MLHNVRSHFFLPFFLAPSHSQTLTYSFRLFERGAESCGSDFQAHPFWDKYIEFEERLENPSRVFAILSRLILLPMHQYSRYFERYSVLSKTQPLDSLAPPNIIAQLKAEVEREMPQSPNPEQELRTKLDAYHYSIFNNTQAEVGQRWTYEQGITRPYYHVTELDDAHLANWSKYLDYEEAQGDYVRTKFLYERCLVIAAHYDEFWLRYARWLSGQKGKQEEVRIAYQRASCTFVPIAQPAIRLHYAKFEESQDRADVAIAIHEAILLQMPSHVETIVSLANLHRRQYGSDAAVEVLRKYTESQQCTLETRGALIAEWARTVSRSTGSSDSSRKLYESTQNQFVESRTFWQSWLAFEIACVEQDASIQYQRVKAVHVAMKQKAMLPQDLIQEMSRTYLSFLEQCGGCDTMAEFLKLDMEINGPVSVQGQAGGEGGGKNGMVMG